MNTMVTQKTIEHVKTSLLVNETKVSDLSNELDPSSWIIKQTGQLAEPHGTLVSITNKEGQALAAAVVTPAAKSQFQKLTKLPKKALANSMAISSIWMAPHVNQANLLPAILYFALRRGRIWDCKNVVSLMPKVNADIPVATILNFETLLNVAEIKDESAIFIAMVQDLQYALYNVVKHCDHDIMSLLQANYIDEIVETTKNWLQDFYQGSWAKAVINGTLTKQQYVNNLYNFYHYVRQTTRLCGRCIYHSEDLPVRNHFIYHLKGEVNHEVLIERDLTYLGYELDYIKNFRIPDKGTKHFMVVQESTIAYYEDPILMLACPLVAEGVTAHFEEKYKNALHDIVASWGYKIPEKACHFLDSHMCFDGGEDGHWAHVVNTIKMYIKTEEELQRFLSVLKAAMDGMRQSFDESVDQLALWSAKTS
jgi:thiaminase